MKRPSQLSESLKPLSCWVRRSVPSRSCPTLAELEAAGLGPLPLGQPAALAKDQPAVHEQRHCVASDWPTSKAVVCEHVLPSWMSSVVLKQDAEELSTQHWPASGAQSGPPSLIRCPQRAAGAEWGCWCVAFWGVGQHRGQSGKGIPCACSAEFNVLAGPGP